MEFRWVVFITVSTFLSGPILAKPPRPPAVGPKSVIASAAGSHRPFSSFPVRR
jgi:hypothetical protein